MCHPRKIQWRYCNRLAKYAPHVLTLRFVKFEFQIQTRIFQQGSVNITKYVPHGADMTHRQPEDGMENSEQ